MDKNILLALLNAIAGTDYETVQKTPVPWQQKLESSMDSSPLALASRVTGLDVQQIIDLVVNDMGLQIALLEAVSGHKFTSEAKTLSILQTPLISGKQETSPINLVSRILNVSTAELVSSLNIASQTKKLTTIILPSTDYEEEPRDGPQPTSSKKKRKGQPTAKHTATPLFKNPILYNEIILKNLLQLTGTPDHIYYETLIFLITAVGKSALPTSADRKVIKQSIQDILDVFTRGVPEQDMQNFFDLSKTKAPPFFYNAMTKGSPKIYKIKDQPIYYWLAGLQVFHAMEEGGIIIRTITTQYKVEHRNDIRPLLLCLLSYLVENGPSRADQVAEFFGLPEAMVKEAFRLAGSSTVITRDGVSFSIKNKRQLSDLASVELDHVRSLGMERWAELQKAFDINRNDPCICGSGKKYKHCCEG